MAEHKFFSEEWCQEALKSEQALPDKVLKEFKNAPKFTHIMGFEVTDRPGVAVQGDYIKGRVQSWTSKNLLPQEQLWALFKGKLENYREAVTGKTPAVNLVMSGKIRLAKGTMKDALENAKGLDILLRHWGTVPTDWDI
jgi:putative sterol carrier protein